MADQGGPALAGRRPFASYAGIAALRPTRRACGPTVARNCGRWYGPTRHMASTMRPRNAYLNRGRSRQPHPDADRERQADRGRDRGTMFKQTLDISPGSSPSPARPAMRPCRVGRCSSTSSGPSPAAGFTLHAQLTWCKASFRHRNGRLSSPLRADFIWVAAGCRALFRGRPQSGMTSSRSTSLTVRFHVRT